MSQRGFTLLEMAVVLILVGTLLAIGTPLLGLLVKQGRLQEERADVRDAAKALIGYALARGGFPAVSADGALPVAELGIKSSGAYAAPFYYDVNDALSLDGVPLTAADFCSRLQAQIAQPRGPRWCTTAACGGYANAAFVVISRGPNGRLDGRNTNDDRRYESPIKGFDDDYEDIVAGYSLYQLAGMACH